MSGEAIRRGDIPARAPEPRYRVYFLDATGRVVQIKQIEAASDHEAIQLTRSWMDGLALELWDDLRFIDHFPTLDQAQES